MVHRVAGLVVVSILIAGCAGGDASPSAASAAAAPPTAAPAVTVAPSATESPAESSAASPAAEAWDLVWISDSSGSGGIPEAYGQRIEADLGIPVVVHDAWTGGLTARNLLEKLRGKDDGMLGSFGSGPVNLPELVRDAEVIVVSGNPEGSGLADTWNCAIYFEEEPACKQTTDCGPAFFEPYVADIEAIFDEIFKIRDGRPVILRTNDWYLPWGPAQTWATCNQTTVCAGCWREYSDAIHRAAAAHGVPVAGYYAAFSGPNGDQPLPSDWIVDDVHPSKTALDAFVGVIADLGYDPVAPTGS